MLKELKKDYIEKYGIIKKNFIKIINKQKRNVINE
jgi:hypothetical protein